MLLFDRPVIQILNNKMEAVSTVESKGGKVSCETSEGTVINININQRSCLDSLLDIIKTVRVVKKAGPDNTPTNQTRSREPLVAGVSFIGLGCFSVMLAVMIAVVQPNLEICFVGAHFWVGFPLIVSGVLNIVAYQKTKAFWVVISFISLLGCLAVTITGLVFVHGDITTFWWRNNMASLCDEVRQSYPYYRNGSGEDYNSAEAIWKLERCKSGFQQYQNLLYGVVVISSIIMVCGLSICIIALNYSLQMIFSLCKCEKAKEENDDDDDDPLLSLSGDVPPSTYTETPVPLGSNPFKC